MSWFDEDEIKTEEQQPDPPTVTSKRAVPAPPPRSSGVLKPSSPPVSSPPGASAAAPRPIPTPPPRSASSTAIAKASPSPAPSPRPALTDTSPGPAKPPPASAKPQPAAKKEPPPPPSTIGRPSLVKQSVSPDEPEPANSPAATRLLPPQPPPRQVEQTPTVEEPLSSPPPAKKVPPPPPPPSRRQPAEAGAELTSISSPQQAKKVASIPPARLSADGSPAVARKPATPPTAPRRLASSDSTADQPSSPKKARPPPPPPPPAGRGHQHHQSEASALVDHFPVAVKKPGPPRPPPPPSTAGRPGPPQPPSTAKPMRPLNSSARPKTTMADSGLKPGTPRTAPRKKHIPPKYAPPPPPPARRRSLSFGDLGSRQVSETVEEASKKKPAPEEPGDPVPARPRSASDAAAEPGFFSEPLQKLAGLAEFAGGLFKGKKAADESKPTREGPPPQPPQMEMRKDVSELVAAIDGMDKFDYGSPELVDYWTSRPMPMEQWIEGYTSGTPSLVDQTVTERGYHIELDAGSVTHTIPEPGYLFVLNNDEDFPWYDRFFSTSSHKNYLYPDGPFAISIEDPFNRDGFCKVIVRSGTEDKRILLSAHKPLKALLQLMPQLKDMKVIKAKGDAIVAELKGLESRQLHSTCKFGVLYCRPHESVENQLFGIQSGSPAYEEFLELIGEKVALQGFSKYRGGLDVKGNNSGTHSIYTTFGSYEIMFHVVTLLPYVESDTQKIDRKRHIGNDVVALVFKDQEDPTDTFNPCILTSHFIHCIIVVTPEFDAAGTVTHYRVTIANKPGVPPYPPFLPQVPRFEKGPEFVQFLLAKNWLTFLQTQVINAGRAALASSEFTSLLGVRRDQLIGVCTSALS